MTTHGNKAALPTLTWAEVCARRLERGYLGATRADDPAQAVVAMCGAHAQVASAAELSVALRVQQATRTTVQDALWRDRDLVKTFGPRGTVHLLRTEDLPCWTGALSAVPAQPSVFSEEARITPEQTERVLAAIDTALSDAELTVDELTDAIVDLAGSWAGDLVMPAFQVMWPRWRQVTGLAAHRGLLCHGPLRGRAVTYTSPRRWLVGFEPAPAQEALAWLVGRYLHAYGPATSQQFSSWLGVPPRWADEVFESQRERLEQVEMDGERAWVGADDTQRPSDPPEGVRLLPYFDAYAVAGQPRARLFRGAAATRALARGQAGNYPVLLVDGIVAGVWHQRRSGRKVTVTVEPFGRLSVRTRRGLDEQVARVGEILDGAPELVIGSVTTGPHA